MSDAYWEMIERYPERVLDINLTNKTFEQGENFGS
jgi:hypothetical protein